MVFRGVYRDGVIVPGSDLGLASGTPIEFDLVRVERATRSSRRRGGGGPSRSKASGRNSAKRSKSRARAAPPGVDFSRPARLTNAQRLAIAVEACGAWRDRPDWKGKSSAKIAEEIRRRAAKRHA